MSGNGYNPITWDCERQGCFNVVAKPKIEVFAECFPGKIAMTDIDGLVEVGGHFMLLEWKRLDWSGELPTGQRILFERLTRHTGIKVVIVQGDPETMFTSRCLVFEGGFPGAWQEIDLETLKRRMKAWADAASVKRLDHVLSGGLREPEAA